MFIQINMYISHLSMRKCESRTFKTREFVRIMRRLVSCIVKARDTRSLMTNHILHFYLRCVRREFHKAFLQQQKI